jgi:transcriptional coactivator HFI1/ADA1
MPDIDPAALSRPMISTTPILPPKTLSASAPIVPKVAKGAHTPPRIELEPLYTALKVAIGEHWATYKEALSLFMLGSWFFNLKMRIGVYFLGDFYDYVPC